MFLFFSLLLALCHGKQEVIALSVGSPRSASAKSNKVLPSSSAPKRSDRVIAVGNLDWMLPKHSVVTLLESAVGPSNTIMVELKELPYKRKKRDAGKFHGGSAKLTFESTSKAQDGLQALQEYSILHGTGFRVEWATLYSLVMERTQAPPAPLSPERIAHRKERAASYARRRERVANRTDALLDKIVEASPVHIRNSLIERMPVLAAPCLDWSAGACPDAVDPVRGGMLDKHSARGQRKQAAVEAFWFVLQSVLLDNSSRGGPRLIADLACGSGNLALPLAFLLNKQGDKMVGVDMNEKSLSRLAERAARANMAVGTMQKNLHDIACADNINNDILSTCAAIVSLHACGVASDLAIEIAVVRDLPFAVSPCCIGKIKKAWRGRSSLPRARSKEESIRYPRSAWLQAILEKESHDDESYQLLAAAADYGVVYDSNLDEDPAELARRKRCSLAKQVVEKDRLLWAEEHGYETVLVELPRIGPLYPKRELLLGARSGSSTAKRMVSLPTT